MTQPLNVLHGIIIGMFFVMCLVAGVVFTLKGYNIYFCMTTDHTSCLKDPTPWMKS